MVARDSLCARLSTCRILALSFIGTLVITGLAQPGWAQSGTNPLFLYKNYFVTGDYVTAGWAEGAPDYSGYAPGTISIPDTLQAQYLAPGVPTSVPAGADIVAAYLYWATVEGNQSSFAGKQAYFNGYFITGQTLGNPNAPTSWSSGGCSGPSTGSKTMRTYRADVRPYLPVDMNQASPTFGALLANGTISVRLADSGSNGNTTPNALGASLVVIYRQLNPPAPLNAVILYDGAFAPNNAGLNISQSLTGFYQPETNPVAKLTHIVANGQANKNETVYFGKTALPSPYTSIYGANAPAFPGLYGKWDNPTWVVSNLVNGSAPGFDTSETTSVVPTLSNSGCVSWGAIVMSTTVQDSDGDGLLDVWEDNQGYNDVVRENDPPTGQNDPTSGQWVALPGANKYTKDLFVEVDYLTNLGATAIPQTLPHSHLPQQATLDAVGTIFANQHINVHFDLGAGIYPGDPFVISYPLAGSPQAGTGGKAIPESLLNCTDGTFLCAYPNQPAVAWKGGLEAIQNFNNSPILGNFQPGRVHSYHYAFFGHSLGEPESFWGTVSTPINTGFGSIQLPQLTSITVGSPDNNGNNTTITLQAPSGQLVTPGDCSLSSPPSACKDANNSRITITGALGQTALNGSYSFAKVISSVVSGIATTTFTVTTFGVTPGNYTYSNEPQLGVAYLGPTSTSGHSDIGGGDSAITLGLWGADDPTGCQPDPSQLVSGGQVYCNNQVGTLGVQIGTLMHELGHANTLTHGGTYYIDPVHPSLPSYEPNCKPNFLSVMSYLFQVRGFVDGGFDYSDQTIAPLNESTSPVNGIPGLSESVGIGNDVFTGLPAQHLTRWYSTPNALDQQLQATTGSRYATAHCDGSRLLSNEPPAVRVDGLLASGGTFSAPLDWNNDLITPDAVAAPGEDLNHNGILGDLPFSGFNDWVVLNGANSVALQQMSARANGFGLSGSGLKTISGGLKTISGGTDDDGGGLKTVAGGLKTISGGLKTISGGSEQTEEMATSTADPATGLACSDCVGSLENNPSVSLTWTAPSFGQVRSYAVWRALGSFPKPSDVIANRNLFTQVGTVSGTPPSTTFADPSTTFQTYTYFVTETNREGVQSAPSASLVVTVAGGSTATAVALSSASSVFGQLVTLTATVTGLSGTPAGTVTFSIDGSPFGSAALSNGTAAVQTTSLNVGNHSITASYAGNADFSASASSILVLSVSQASTTTALSNSPATIVFGQPATLMASVAPVAPGGGTPTGSVTFLDGTNALGTVALSGGTATYSLSSVGAGNHSFNATYSGDGNFAGSNAPTYPVTIGKATAAITLGNPSPTFDGTPKSVTITTNPAGLTVNTTYNGSPTAPTNAGSFAVVATINSPNYQGSANGTLTIAKAGSVTTIISDTPNPSVIGQVVTVSFKVAASAASVVPTGSVAVTASTGEACGPVVLTSGLGSCSITFSTAVSRTITASYTGDNNFLASTATSVNQPVGDFSIGVTPPAQTIPSGHQAFYNVILAPIDGLTGTVNLSCTGAPPNSTCIISPSTATLQSSQVQSTVTLSANQNVNHGQFTLTISATLARNGLTHATTVQLTVK